MAVSTHSGGSVVLPLAEGSVRRLRVSEYHRMIDAGILAEDERVELIEGVLVQMSPQHRSHARVIEWLTRHLNRTLSDEYAVLPQLPLALDDFSEPEPDVSVVPAQAARSSTEHPNTACLVVEVSRGSIEADRHVKGAMYARAGIPEYWIVNLDERLLEVYRDPERAAGRYRQQVDYRPADTVEALSVPGLSVRVAELLGE